MTNEQRQKAEEELLEYWCESPEMVEANKAYNLGIIGANHMSSMISAKMDYLSGVSDAELSDMLAENEIDLYVEE